MKQVEKRSMCFAIIFSIIVSFGADWPTYMKDGTRMGHTTDGLSPSLSLAWMRASATPPQWAWPGPGGKVIEGLELKHRIRFDDVFHVAVVGDSVYFGSSVDNTIYCVAADTGEVRWHFVTSGPIRLAPTVHNGRVFVGSDDGYVYCLNAESGERVWQLRAGPRDEWILARGRMAARWPVRTGVLVDGGVAYFAAGIFPHETVYVYAADAETGRVIWKNDTVSQRDAGRNDLSPQGYLLATSERLFVPSGRTLPAAFSRETGELLHKQTGGGKQIGGSEAMLVDDVVLSVGEHHILALDQQAGSIDNRFRGRRIVFNGRFAYIADGENITAMDRDEFASIKKQRVELVSELAGQKQRLLRNPAPVHLDRVREARTALENARNQNADPGSTQGRVTDATMARLTEDVSAAEATYEASRLKYEELKGTVQQLVERLDALTHNAIKWRTPIKHESSMILAGDTLVVGGASEVALLNVDTGEIAATLDVNAEARGLAAAEGRLYVSTTAGRIYCFAETGASAAPRPIAHTVTEQAPFPEDEWTNLYAAAAEQIVERSGITQGYCLVVGSRQGRLAYELARRTALKIYCVESDAANVAYSRDALAKTGLYGHRISVDHRQLSTLPYPNYFANLIVSDALVMTGSIPGDPRQIARHLKPEGGTICLGVPDEAGEDVRQRAAALIPNWIGETQLSGDEAEIVNHEGWTRLSRNALPRTSGWTHQYGNPGNTSTVQDDRIHGGIRVLWYGDPGPSSMSNRHSGAVGPVSAGGKLFVQGEGSVMAYDAFNGSFLWEQYNPQALRTGVFNNFEPGNLVAGGESLFMVTQDKCLQMDADTGKVIKTFAVPERGDGNREWGYVAYVDGRLYGTSTQRKWIAAEARRRGHASESSNTDQIFAIDLAKGELLWTHQGQSISHTTIAIDDNRLFFVDSALTSEQRDELLRQDKSALQTLTGEARQLAEDRLKRMDARRAVALDCATGDVLWAHAVDVTDCTGVGIGAGRLTVMASDGYLVLCGANANGHYWRQFLDGEFKRRRIVVLSTASGEKVWARDANYRHRPIIVGQRLVAEPWAFGLDTGEPLMRTHPLTGESSPWKFIRPGHHCGAISATPNLMFFRSGFTAYYDFQTDEGTNHFAGHRLGCWINTIPANGLVMIPEASAGCACLFSLTSTIVFEPRENQQVWSVFTAEGATQPVQHMALNLGAPGDRRDAHGKLWLSYPRPSSRKGLDLPLDLRPLSPFGVSGSFFQFNSESYDVQNTDLPWVFSSGMVGVTRCELPLIDPGSPPANYQVRLLFAALEGDQPGQRVFDIRLQDRTVSKGVDIVKQAGSALEAVTLEFDDIRVTKNLAIELWPVSGARHDRLPALCGIEVLRSGSNEILRVVAQD